MIFIDTNVLAETMRPRPAPAVIHWLIANDHLVAVPAIVIAEIAYGIEKIRHDERSPRLQSSLDEWRRRFAGRIYGFDEEAALIYGHVMGAARRKGETLDALDGMIASIALRHDYPLATRNIAHFAPCSVRTINPWG
ncbi:type II toxin-antitoxin system VapC family toxin [Labrys monachus]|uniref:Ribonuclease VapC n=1 Tax=Labrys monachus TaxID=217067 RepID=A0ABU0FN84_9HYPH|nr:type II toxin-antitoxin system VapC family toxin [Labrys monachus]MDQ0395822.1 putative nucleic acid-binding protein [Labrys monachus]